VSKSRPLEPPVPLAPLVGGGSGRAKGFGGPEAPAERSAEAEGDGGGRTGPGVSPGSRMGVRMLLEFLFEVAAVRLSEAVSVPGFSSASSSAGICTLSFGFARELERLGGIWGIEETAGVEEVR
jgi:hypothetical protein